VNETVTTGNHPQAMGERAAASDSAPREPRPTGTFYRPELDGLRFLAFLVVFVCHALQPAEDFWVRKTGALLGPWVAAGVRGGRFGVDLFFVLSSYLITEILLRERRRQPVNVKAFWARRILRIWPLYFTFLLAAILFAPRIMVVEHLSTRYAVAFAFFAGNWAVATGGFQASVVMHLWSVSMEEQFYLSWPLAVRWLSPRRLVGLTIALIPISMLVRAYLTVTHGDAREPVVWVNTFARLDPIAIGALLAMKLDGRVPALGAWRARGLIAGGALIVLLVSRYEVGLFAHPVGGALGYTAVAVACAMTIVGALGLGPGSALARPVPVYLGRISYGAYVFHYFCAHLVSQRANSALAPVWSFALTIALASASYRWLETPFLKLKDRFSPIHRGAAPTPAASAAPAAPGAQAPGG
jgi:peptidoglycan/LPS O-acetylase OafA/YrhL